MIKIYSFSFLYSDVAVFQKRHALSYIFDCRPLKNPGRIEHLALQTGLDKDVANYLVNESNVKNFINPVADIVNIALKEYLDKQDRYEEVSFYFGCTGGRHRSVYCAQEISRFIKENFNLDCEVRHLNL